MDAAELFGVLSDRSRRRVFELVVESERTVGELVRATRLRQPLVSHHLKVLRDAGLVAARKEGRHRFYRIASSDVGALVERLETDAGKLTAAAEAALERNPYAPVARASAVRAGARSKR